MNTETLTPWEQKQAESKARLTEFVQPIIKLLNGSWTLAENKNGWRVYCQGALENTEGRFYPEVSFAWENEKEERILVNYSVNILLTRKHAFGNLYTKDNVQVESPKGITVGKKAPEKIAGDINRKLLPEIEKYHTLLIERVLQTESAAEKQKNCVLRIAKATGSEASVMGRNNEIKDSFYLQNLREARRITVSGADLIQLENWSVTESEFMQIVKILAKR